MSRNNGHPREPFGQVAIRKGYVTQEQVKQALQAQHQLSEKGHRHKLIGLVMLELGLLGTSELIEVLKDIGGHSHSTSAAQLPRPDGV